MRSRLPLCLAVAAFLLEALPAGAQVREPLTQMGPRTYLGFSGGLYANGNDMPAIHAAAGAVRAAAVQPRDASGNVSPTGAIAMLSIGMSNTTQEFCSAGGRTPCASWSFVGQALADPEVDRVWLKFVNGARGGQTAQHWDSPTDPNYDRIRDVDLAEQGLTEAQVQVVWVKVANAGPNNSMPAANSDAALLVQQTGNIARALKVRYPNVQLVFLSSRIYAGYATVMLNPEPFAYETGFGAKWVIQAQVDQMEAGGTIVDPRAGDMNYDTVAPWIGWGAYLWGSGTTPRCDGLVWLPEDFQPDGTHPSQSGEQKVGAMLLAFFKTSPLTRRWFLALGDTSVAPASGPASGGTSLAISGRSFEAGATVEIGGMPASVTGTTPTSISVVAPALAAAALHDMRILNPGGTAGTIPEGYFSDFADVHALHPFHDFVEKIRRRRVTAGCGAGTYCPDADVTRAQMAPFLLVSRYGACFLPAEATGSLFADVPGTDPFASWIEQLASLGVTAGCGGGLYCPQAAVTRAQMAVFLLATREGAGYTPPPAIGVFEDVPPSHFAAAWIEDLFARGIAAGCGASPPLYCPDAAVTRGEMAVFLTGTFFP
jgi:hypothetical protein